jgi:hypothetical protein
MHLLPCLRKLDGVDPLVVSRVANIIEVVVDAGVTLSADLAGNRKALDIAAVVVTPEDRHIVGDLHSLLIVPSDFLMGGQQDISEPTDPVLTL